MSFLNANGPVCIKLINNMLNMINSAQVVVYDQSKEFCLMNLINAIIILYYYYCIAIIINESSSVSREQATL